MLHGYLVIMIHIFEKPPVTSDCETFRFMVKVGIAYYFYFIKKCKT